MVVNEQGDGEVRESLKLVAGIVFVLKTDYEDKRSGGMDENAHPIGCRANPLPRRERRWAEWIYCAKPNFCNLVANLVLVLGALSH